MPVARSIRVVLALAVLLAWALPAAALQPDKALHHYVRSTWSIEEGLPQISALAIAQDRRGYLWVGTQSGLARFDGVRFETFTSDDTPALAGIWVRALHAGRDGRLWIGTYKGLAVHDGRTFQPVAAADPVRWPSLDIHALAEDAQGQVWVATQAGVFEVRGDTLHHVAGSPEPALSLAWSDGRWAVGSRGAVHYPGPGGWQHDALPAAAGDPPVNRPAQRCRPPARRGRPRSPPTGGRAHAPAG